MFSFSFLSPAFTAGNAHRADDPQDDEKQENDSEENKE